MVNNQDYYSLCTNCSAQLPNNVKFCTECGCPIEHDSSHNSSYQRPRNVENDPVESIKESGQEFMNEISKLFNKSNNKLLAQDGIHFEGSINEKSYCQQCSALIPNNVNFCTECGSPIEHNNDQTSNQSPKIQDETYNNELEKLEYLEKLAGLRDKAIITDEEFEKKKKDILKL